MKSTVLIIDDEEKLRNLLSRIIKSEGFEVLEAADCKTGFKRVEQNDIDVVFCDVKLPDGNGVDLTQQIKSKSPSSEVILLTAYGNISDGDARVNYEFRDSKPGPNGIKVYALKTDVRSYSDTNRFNIDNASAPSTGLPIMQLSITTIVSAPIINVSGERSRISNARCAFRRAFSRATE